jgi:hypothetical protein
MRFTRVRNSLASTPRRGLAGDAEERGGSRPRGQEHRVEPPFREELVEAGRAAHEDVRPDLHAQRAHALQLLVEDGLGQPELGDPVTQDAARACRASNTVTP